MHQTKKGNEWHFGMKAHAGVDADSGLVHSVVTTAANESDVSQAHALLHGHELEAFGDAGYTGVDRRDEMKGKTVKWQVALKRGKIKAMSEGALKDLVMAAERTKAQIRARVEHPFHVVKNCSGIVKCATGCWPGTRRSCSACSRWRTWWWRVSGCGHVMGTVRLAGEECRKSAARAPRICLDGLPILENASRIRQTNGDRLIDQRFPKRLADRMHEQPVDAALRQPISLYLPREAWPALLWL